ncbi:hypothetical protein CPB83DRAFT_853538 [Crepidotus variabilis]|uniref:RRM domain-containing protein n=1 Tax=Crepidotus variabilis TaxID=179855 RepID=A0A9P6EHB1_9AGAR|nr:hypothetical protein CPB83DRAFT_853538 [Crepidotus variabilis]
MATDEPLTKRVIISGLTPAITVEDITRRLGSFGTVKAADGFGLPNGLGEPRNFGYVTLETTTSKFGRCMNLLSGSTWKGAKLRFGVAKPDYRERILLENQRAAEEPPNKKRKAFGPTQAEDMTVVTPENAAQRPGWKVSSLGRVTRPMKMRPLHPLPEVQEETSRRKHTGKVPKPGEKKKKLKLKDPDTRSRRKFIDMPKCGSTYLKGVFLDLEVGSRKADDRDQHPDILMGDQDSSESEPDTEASKRRASIPIPDDDPVGLSVSKLSIRDVASPPSSKPDAPEEKPKTTVTSQKQSTSLPDIQSEKTQALSLLSSLFGGQERNDEDSWVGRESVGSDIDVDDITKGDVILDEDGDDFEIVPRSKRTEPVPSSEDTVSSDDNVVEPQELIQEQDPPPKATSAQKKLKDLFAPREEQAGFSLLGHLDLDLEFDDDVDIFTTGAEQQHLDIVEEPELMNMTTATTISLPSQSSQAPIVLDPKIPLFFPLPRLDNTDFRKPRPKDVYDVIEEHGWSWRDPTVKFWKTETDEEIRKHWEETRGDLTRDWKRRWREAGKVRKRKKGGDNDE